MNFIHQGHQKNPQTGGNDRSLGCFKAASLVLMSHALDPFNLAALLFEQQSLTAASRFSQRHDGAGFPAQARYYRDLIPLTAPRPEAGEQYAFEVDLDQ